MKTGTKSLEKPTPDSPKLTRPKSNLKAGLGNYKGVIIEKNGCWDDDLKKTIVE